MKINSLLRAISFILLLLITPPITRGAECYLFNKLRDDNWLLSSANSIYNQDDTYLWIGTDKGVYRYDGYNLKYYMNYMDPTLSLGQISYKLYMDEKGNLWNLSISGLGLYIPEEDRFQYEIGKNIITGAIYSSCSMEKGVVFGGQGKLYFFCYDTQKIQLLKDFEEFNEDDEFRNIYRMDDETLLFCTSHQLCLLNMNTGNFQTIDCPSEITSLYVDEQKNIWAGLFHKGLYHYTSNGKLKHFYNTQNSDLTCDEILCIEQKDSLLWLGTDGGGINIFDKRNNKFNYIQHIMGLQQSHLTNSIRCLYNDNNQTIWAGTVRNGVIGIRRSSIFTYTEVNEGSNYGLSNSSVLCIYQEDDDHVWIGTDGEGINRMDVNSSTMMRNLFPSDDKSMGQMHTNARIFRHFPDTRHCKVVSIASFDSTYLLVSLYYKGLMLFNKSTGKLQPFEWKGLEMDDAVFKGKICTYLINESDDTILLVNDNIYRLHIHDKRLETLSIEPYKGYSNILPAGEFNDKLYFHNTHNVFSLDRNSRNMNLVLSTDKEITINSASVDAQGQIWMASNQGLKIYSIQQHQYIHKTHNLYKNLSTVTSDKKGNVCITSGSEVYIYLKRSDSFALLGVSDGVLPNDFIKGSSFVNKQGDLFLGGSQGLLVIDHSYKLDNMNMPKVKLGDILIDGVEIAHRPQNSNDALDIPADTKSIKLFVTTVENDILRPKVYKFEVRGTHEYVLESHIPIFKMNSPRSGISSIYVSSQTRNGEWTKPELLITLNMLQPWYKTNLFRFFCLVVLLCLVGGWIWLENQRKETKMRMLIKEKEKGIYEEKVRFLIHITHELRTPLTLIFAPLKRLLLQTEKTSSQYNALNRMCHQAERMQGLLNMVLDLRKMEVGEQAVNIESHPLNEWIVNIVADFNDEDPSGIKIETELDTQLGDVCFDMKKCEIILSNLLINAIKHSHPGDTICVKTEIIDKGFVEVSVIDQGDGLAGVDTNKLFESFYQGENETLGTGLGLSYSRLLIELQGGQIGAFNNAEKGATFYFRLPMSLNAGCIECAPKAYINDIFPDKNKNWTSVEKDLTITDYPTTEKILMIVDDSKELTDYLYEVFSPRFKKVIIADNGENALHILNKTQPDIIVSDIMMPQMDGYELCQKIKSNLTLSHIPVILLTARNEGLSKQLGYKLGADDFVPKPFDTDILLDIISSKLKIRDSIKQKYIHLSGLPEPQEDTFSQADERFLLRLNEVINQNLDNGALGVPFICSELGISKGTLYNKLKAITGISCNEYVNKIRLENAKEMVGSTDLTFVEISDKTGFSNSCYFSTCFKQYFGMTPTQYREECRKEQE